MNDINNERNKSSVILNPERSEWVSRSHVTSVESVVNDGAKTKRYSAKRDLYAHSPNGSRLKMTTPVSCREAHKRRFLFNLIQRSLVKFFKKNFRDDRFCFGFAKILALALILSLVTISKSHAEETSTIVTGTCNDDETCLWKFDTSTGKMTISAVQGTGKVSMKNYACNDSTRIGNRPWENYITQIKDIVVEENITNIGNEAFQNAVNLKTVTGMKNVKSIGYDGFAFDISLTQIETPAVEYLASYSLGGTKLTSIDLPNIKRIDEIFSWAPLQYVGLPDYDVSISPNAFINVSNLHECSNENRSACGSCGNDYVKRGVGCVSDCGTGYLGKDGRCIDASLGCGAGYRQFENFCNRIRWTPAEAAEVLHNDNTNSVTITFKK